MELTDGKTFKNAWLEFIQGSGKVAYHISVTFRYDLPAREATEYLNDLLHLVNQRLFGRKYKERDKHLKGFAFVEKQASGAPHFHLLVLWNRKFFVAGKPSLEDIVFRLARKVHKINRLTGGMAVSEQTGRPVPAMSPRHGIRIRREYNASGLRRYALKTMRHGDDSFIGVLCGDGVAWCV